MPHANAFSPFFLPHEIFASSTCFVTMRLTSVFDDTCASSTLCPQAARARLAVAATAREGGRGRLRHGMADPRALQGHRVARPGAGVTAETSTSGGIYLGRMGAYGETSVRTCLCANRIFLPHGWCHSSSLVQSGGSVLPRSAHACIIRVCIGRG